MKAYVLRDIGKFGMEEAVKPSPGEKEVLVSVKAAGICGSDIPRIYETGTYSYPLIPGHEFSGVVSELGAGADSFWLGKRVGIFPLIPCGKCVQCLDKKYELCRSYSYLGSRTHGGFAEYVKVPEWNLIELPDRVSFEQAAMLEPMAVAVHAIRRAKVLQNDTVAVCGLGAIGLLLFILLKKKGIRNILLIGNKSFQKTMVLKLGAGEDSYCDSRTEDADRWLYDRTGGQGAKVFFDCTGRNEVVSLALRNTAPCGTVLLVGNPISDIVLNQSDYWKILRNQLIVAGTWNSSFFHGEDDDWNYCLQRMGAGEIRPELFITQRISLEDLVEATEMMRDKKMPYIKVMVKLSEDEV